MKSRFVFLSYYVLLLSILGLSIYANNNIINVENGFFIQKSSGNLIVFAIILCAMLFSVVCFSIRRCPLKNPTVNSPLAVMSIPLFFSLLADIIAKYVVSDTVSISILPLLLSLSELFFAAFLLLYSIKSFIRYRLHSAFYVAPLLFWLIKMITVYIEVSTMGLTLENAFYVLASTFSLIFFLYFLKYQNRISTDYSHKVFLLVSFLAAASCEAYAVPQLLSVVKNPQITLHNSVVNYLIYAFSGLFIVIFIRSFFSSRNLKRKRKQNFSLLIFNE